MKNLKLKYQKGTKTYSQIHCNNKAFIYKVNDLEIDHIYYEVFERRYNRRFDCVCYPTDKAFGSWAWCISRGEDNEKAFMVAMEKFNMISMQRRAA